MITTPQIITNFLLELMTIRAFCAALDMRSNFVFAILNMAGMFLGFALDAMGANPLFRTGVIAPVTLIVLPVAYSKGPLKQRIARCAIICTALMAIDFLSALLFIGILDPSQLESFVDLDLQATLLVCVVSLLSSALIFELLLLFFRRHDKTDDFNMTPSLVVLLLWSYALTVFSITISKNALYSINTSVTLTSAIYYVLVVLLCLFSVVMFRQDLYATGQADKHMASTRQSKHMRAEIDAAVRRAAIARRLHHELANTSQAIVELANEGNAEKANAYLSALRTQAQSVTQGILVESHVSHSDPEAT